ncbi:MAG: type II secretion system GspH family protein [Candidatus Riflebacteria bacterium]|nr:type II secretion system GspH family protein [Candidatus Riflebacteria bacterium]
MRKRKGFTLLEICIGMLLLGGVLVIYLQSMQSSKKKNEYYSEHFIASIMAAKVVEACFQEADINLYGIEALGLVDKDGQGLTFSTPVTDGQTVFFKAPEITLEQHPHLYSMFSKDFMLDINSEKDAKQYFTLNTAFAWKAATGAGKFNFYCNFPGSVLRKEPHSTFAFPEAKLEKKLVERFFEEKNKNLGTIISSPGAREVALSTGRIYFSTSSLLADKPFTEAFATAEKLAAEPHAPTSVKYYQATELYFGIARDILDLMLFLKPEVERLSKDLDKIDSMNLRTKTRLQVFIQRSGLALDKLRQVFLISVNEAASRYRAQMQSSTSLKSQRLMIEKCLSMHRLMIVTADFSDGVFVSDNAYNIIRSEYSLLLATLARYFADKDQSIVRLAAQEKRFADDNMIKDRYFVCDLVYQLFSEIAALKAKLPDPDPGVPDPDLSVIGQPSGNGTAAGAITWAQDQMNGGSGKGLNVNIGKRICDDPKAWNDWNLAFVSTAYNGSKGELLVGSAIDSYSAWESKGKVKTTGRPPAGAIMYTAASAGNPYGHIFIATGKSDESGDPIVITTGSSGSFDGVREMTLSQVVSWASGKYLGYVSPE